MCLVFFMSMYCLSLPVHLPQCCASVCVSVFYTGGKMSAYGVRSVIYSRVWLWLDRFCCRTACIHLLPAGKYCLQARAHAVFNYCPHPFTSCIQALGSSLVVGVCGCAARRVSQPPLQRQCLQSHSAWVPLRAARSVTAGTHAVTYHVHPETCAASMCCKSHA